MKTAVVIGSGLSGMTMGAYLARDGYRVAVYEQYGDIGGVTAGLRKEGYYWDLGQLVLEGFGRGEQAGMVLEELGILDRVPLERGDRAYAFPDFQLWKPEHYEGFYWRREKLKKLFPGEARGLDRYYRYYIWFYELITIARKAERAGGVKGFLYKVLLYAKLLPHLPKMKWSAQRMMSHFFSSQRLQAVFMSILADFVVKPSQFPGLGIAAVNPEPAFECRLPLEVSRKGRQPSYNYIRGGCRSLIDELAGVIKKHGGSIVTGSAVKRVNIMNKKAAGVTLEDGSSVEADLVVASGGAKECFFDLVGREHLGEKFATMIEGIPLMESVFMVHLGVDIDPSGHQKGPLCYYYRTYDIEEGVDKLQGGVYHEGEDGFLLFIPSMALPDMAPPGRHAVTVYTIAPNVLNEGTWEGRKEEYRDKLLALAEEIIPGLREHVLTQTVLTPEDFKRRTHLKHHSFGGCSPVMGKKGAPHRTPVSGLWFVGAQSESGAGMNNVIEGVWRTVRMIRKG